ncbi:hypothetical protein K458DRAFT_302044 [Lentithecium fluviatile CBS 122367]|uniref:Fe2OG dioxygenase domain-containing protein n=1 Tax=Lentithecium fluviatile CBS 122367 TaxID=1168545 RepID=A0A6G1J2H2_9PLEO|nr:hypothetical protein K458DRAFT_302044 [Lentithecium fluviatile CBS 122367]
MPGVNKFDPRKHLSYAPPKKVLKMTDLGYAEDTGVSPVAVSHPFQLFTEEAVDLMRTEIFKKEVQEECTFGSNLAPCVLRGYAKKHAPFTYEAWNHPDTLALISHIAGVGLVPVMDYEIAHVNCQTKTESQAKEERERSQLEDEGRRGCQENRADKPIVGWHTDSYPFVCVLMMSDCEGMIGGETALRTADGQYIKVRGPAKGCAVILQGRYIAHQAMRALGTRERITAVTSFRPNDPFLRDDSELRTVRPVSDLSELYHGFAEYRLEMMGARIKREREKLAADRRDGKKFDTLAHKTFLRGAITFVEQTNGEIFQQDKVEKGIIDELNLADPEIESERVEPVQSPHVLYS